MTPQEFEHVVRAVGAALGVDLRKTGVISDRLLLERLDEIDGLEEAVRTGVRASVTAGRVQH